jgi:hypothetical protein
MRRVVPLGVLVACSATPDAPSPEVRSLRQSVLDGEASDRSDVVYISHASSVEQCTGALLRGGIVLTAAHCAMPRDGVSTELLEATGFRVGFGASTDALELIEVVEVQAPERASGLTAEERGRSGLDIVALMLSDQPTAGGFEADFAFHPNTQTELTLVGYGISSLETGRSGERREARSLVVGWDRDSGELELDQGGACLGDSGGPALTTDGHWVGLVSSVSADQRGSPCGGRTILTTLLHPDVAAWLGELAEFPPRPSTTDGGAESGDTSSESGAPPTTTSGASSPDSTDAGAGNMSCAVSRRTEVPWCASWGLLGWAAWRQRRRDAVSARRTPCDGG